MKHMILSKFKERSVVEKILPEVREIFERTLEIPGIRNVELRRCCIDRPNRYDLLIEIEMDRDALEAYDVSLPHKEWKEKFGDLLQDKAIFDYED